MEQILTHAITLVRRHRGSWVPSQAPPLPPRTPPIYTFIPMNILQPDAKGMQYVLNSAVINEHGEIRYTLVTTDKRTVIRDPLGKEIAIVDWDHVLHARISVRQEPFVRCKDWFPFQNEKRWNRVNDQDMFSFMRDSERVESSPICVATVNKDNRLVVGFHTMNEEEQTEDAIIVALALLYGDGSWLKLGQLGPKQKRAVKIALSTTVSIASVVAAIAGATTQ